MSIEAEIHVPYVQPMRAHKYEYGARIRSSTTLPQLVASLEEGIQTPYYGGLDSLETLLEVWAFDARMKKKSGVTEESPIVRWPLMQGRMGRRLDGMEVSVSDASIGGTAEPEVTIRVAADEAASDGSNNIISIKGLVGYEAELPKWSFRVEAFRPELLLQQQAMEGEPGREAGDGRFDRLENIVKINNILGGQVFISCPDGFQEEFRSEGELVRSLRSQPGDENAAALLAALDQYPARIKEAMEVSKQRLIAAQPAYWCKYCGETFYDPEECERHMDSFGHYWY